MYVPTQILWSLPSWKPVRESHVHWKEPAVLIQLPRGSQPSLPTEHSSMSKGKEKTVSSLTWPSLTRLAYFLPSSFLLVHPPSLSLSLSLSIPPPSFSPPSSSLSISLPWCLSLPLSPSIFQIPVQLAPFTPSWNPMKQLHLGVPPALEQSWRQLCVPSGHGLLAWVEYKREEREEGGRKRGEWREGGREGGREMKGNATYILLMFIDV